MPSSAYNGQYVPLVSPPATLTANVDTPLNFGQQVRAWSIQNNSAAVLYYNLDAVATVGSFAIAAGARFDGSDLVTVIHLLAASALTVNGTTAGGVVVRGSV